MHGQTKKVWRQPSLETLDVSMTMGGPNWCNPDANNDGHNNSVKCDAIDPGLDS